MEMNEYDIYGGGAEYMDVDDSDEEDMSKMDAGVYYFSFLFVPVRAFSSMWQMLQVNETRRNLGILTMNQNGTVIMKGEKRIQK